MMTRQTRIERGNQEIEKANLSLYLQILKSKPSVSQVQTLRQKEVDRSHLVNLLSTRVQNAGRVKNIANSKLRKIYGKTGSSNRLIQKNKTFKEGSDENIHHSQNSNYEMQFE